MYLIRQWTGFCMITASVMKELILKFFINKSLICFQQYPKLTPDILFFKIFEIFSLVLGLKLLSLQTKNDAIVILSVFFAAFQALFCSLEVGVNTLRFYPLALTDHMDNYGWGWTCNLNPITSHQVIILKSWGKWFEIHTKTNTLTQKNYNPRKKITIFKF